MKALLRLYPTFSDGPDLDFHQGGNERSTGVASSWPTHFEGAALHRSEPTGFQLALTANFPGEFAFFRSAGRQIILRCVTQSTRRLHPSQACLRAAGYDISSISTDCEGWLTYYANNDEQTLHVRERITESTSQRTWNSPAKWFWHATLYPHCGPWLAITVITPLKNGSSGRSDAPSDYRRRDSLTCDDKLRAKYTKGMAFQSHPTNNGNYGIPRALLKSNQEPH